MYYYIYDEFVQDSKYERELAQIETRLTDLGISGKVARLALFRDASELIKDEIRKGAKNIIAVGNDLTLRKVIDAAGESGVAMGIIPLGGENTIAEMIGVPSGIAACEIVAARIVHKLDTGVVNGKRFIHKFFFDAPSMVKIACGETFSLQCLAGSRIEVRNLDVQEDAIRAARPTDGKLDLIIQVPERGWFGRKQIHSSVLSITDAHISIAEPVRVFVDGEEFSSADLRVRVMKNHLTLITGKQRLFVD